MKPYGLHATHTRLHRLIRLSPRSSELFVTPAIARSQPRERQPKDRATDQPEEVSEYVDPRTRAENEDVQRIKQSRHQVVRLPFDSDVRADQTKDRARSPTRRHVGGQQK